MTAPNSAKPTISESAPAIANTGSRHSAGGSTGSAARRSTNANATSEPTPSAAVNTTANESHAHVIPPSDVTSTIAASPVARSPAPR